MANWTGKTKGNLLGYGFVIWFMKLFGLSNTYKVLRVISFYFYIFSSSSKKHLRVFYKERLGYSEKDSNKLMRENFNLLAQSIVDRIAASMGMGKEISFSRSGGHWLEEISDKKEGGFLISAHLSNWDIAGHSLDKRLSKVNVLMLENEHEQIKGFLDKHQKERKFNIISQKEDRSHMIKIYQAIKQGEFVCMHADRFVQGAPTIILDFLGKKAAFPLGPFQIIHKLKKPYTFVFTVKIGKFDYHFSATEPKMADGDATDIAKEYVATLEQKVKENPNQWFNYHDFYATYEEK